MFAPMQGAYEKEFYGEAEHKNVNPELIGAKSVQIWTGLQTTWSPAAPSIEICAKSGQSRPV